MQIKWAYFAQQTDEKKRQDNTSHVFIATGILQEDFFNAHSSGTWQGPSKHSSSALPKSRLTTIGYSVQTITPTLLSSHALQHNTSQHQEASASSPCQTDRLPDWGYKIQDRHQNKWLEHSTASVAITGTRLLLFCKEHYVQSPLQKRAPQNTWFGSERSYPTFTGGSICQNWSLLLR